MQLPFHSQDTDMKFLEAECVDVEPEAKRIRCQDKSGVVGEVSDFHVSICNNRHRFPMVLAC